MYIGVQSLGTQKVVNFSVVGAYMYRSDPSPPTPDSFTENKTWS